MVPANQVKSIFQDKKVVAFDFDDTLCQTVNGFELENKAAATLGMPPMSRATHLSTWGEPMTKVLQIRFPGINEKAFIQAFSSELAKAVKEGWFDQIPEKNLHTLEFLKQNGYRLALLTSRSLTEAKHLVDPNHPLSRYIEKFYYLDNCAHHKPDGRVFDGLLQDFRVTPDQVVYVGDSVGDAQACEQAGITFIVSLESGLRKREDFTGLEVRAYINDFQELIAFL